MVGVGSCIEDALPREALPNRQRIWQRAVMERRGPRESLINLQYPSTPQRVDVSEVDLAGRRIE